MTYLTWALWLACAIMALIVVVRTLGSDGESRKMGRLAAAGGIFVIATALMIFAGTTPSGVPLLRAFSPTHALDAKLAAANLSAAKERARALRAQLDQANKAADEAQRQATVHPGTGTLSSAESTLPDLALEPLPPVVQNAVPWILLMLALIEVALLLFMGGALFLAGDKYHKEQAARLEELSALVWNADYRGALAKAAEINEMMLRQPDQLDLRYLRSYAAVQVYSFPQPGETTASGRGLLDAALKDLERVVEIEPKRGSALYLLALAYGFDGSYDRALALFERAQKALGTELPFDHNISVCLLRSGETHLSVGDIEAAEGCFERVAMLGLLAAAVLQVRIKIGMIDLRNAMSKRATGAAQATLQKIVGFAGLSTQQKATMDVIGIELNARAALAQNDPARAAAEAERFIAAYLPVDLPPVSDDIADEAFSPLLDADLAYPREIYRDILFILAVARCTTETGRHGKLSESQVAQIAEPLLRALQIEPRHRDLLAALGGLYYWMRPDTRQHAREWIEAAVTMGVDSRFARLILAQDRAIEADRRSVLDQFRSASARFLRDPSLASEMRRALVEELGRFQEFEPMVISLQARGDFAPEEATLSTLRDRAKYLAEMMVAATRRGDTARYERLKPLHGEFVRSLATLEESSRSIETLERAVIAEMGKALAFN